MGISELLTDAERGIRMLKYDMERADSPTLDDVTELERIIDNLNLAKKEMISTWRIE